MKKVVYLSIGAIMAFNACSKKEGINLEEKPNGSSVFMSNSLEFMTIDPKELAQLHNKVLGDLHEIQRVNPNFTLKDCVMALQVDISNPTKQFIYDSASYYSDPTANQAYILTVLETTAARDILNNMSAIVLSSTDTGYVNAELRSILNQSVGVISTVDYQIISIYAETAMASLSYWNQWWEENDLPSAADWVNKDGMGIAQASIGWAIGAAVCGGGPCGYFLACGIGGALNSIM